VFYLELLLCLFWGYLIKKGTPPEGMFQLYAIPNNDYKAVILYTANGIYKIANLEISPNFESGDRFKGPAPE
tara:strand:- start:143 stop:358 length:216 start_codon:yes stop_codon:yes gene_type:complete